MLGRIRGRERPWRPKAGVSIAGVRVQSHLGYRLKGTLIRGGERWRAVDHLPVTWIVRAVTRVPDPARRRRWVAAGRLRALEPVLRRGRARITFGVAQGAWLASATLDLGGAQVHGVVRGLHEPMVQEALRRHLPRGGVLYDVGANIGFMSLVGAALAGRRGQVVALDPEPANAAALSANAALNPGLAPVLVLQAAATEREGPVEMLAVDDTLWSRPAAVGDHDLERERFVAAGVALDDVPGRWGARAPDVVKIDVEGAELEVLRGMGRMLAEVRPAVVVEMHGRNAEVCALFEEAGYEVHNLEGTEPVAEAHGNVHALALPAGARAD